MGGDKNRTVHMIYVGSVFCMSAPVAFSKKLQKPERVQIKPKKKNHLSLSLTASSCGAGVPPPLLVTMPMMALSITALGISG